MQSINENFRAAFGIFKKGHFLWGFTQKCLEITQKCIKITLLLAKRSLFVKFYKGQHLNTRHWFLLDYSLHWLLFGAVIMHKMFDAGTKHLSATDGQLKVFLGPCGWRNSIFKPPSCTFTSVTMPTHQNYCRTADTQKTLNVLCIYFFSQWFVEIKLKKLSNLICEFVSNFAERYCYKIVTTPCSRHSLWFCKVIL